MKALRNTVVLTLSILTVLSFQTVFAAETAPGRTLAPYFVPVTPGPKAPDADGFLQRWLLLEPISLPIRSNAGFTEAFVRETITPDYIPNVVPKDGDKVTVNGQELMWHALDTTTYNAKVFRFAYGLNKPEYGVMFWLLPSSTAPVKSRTYVWLSALIRRLSGGSTAKKPSISLVIDVGDGRPRFPSHYTPRRAAILSAAVSSMVRD